MGVCVSFFTIDILNFILWNPSVQKYISLLQHSLTCLTNNTYVISGFGFGSRTNDCKLLRVSGEIGETLTEAYLFSLNGNSWTRILLYLLSISLKKKFHGPLLMGLSIGWGRRKNGGFRNTVLGFDISAEEFLLIRLPESLIGLRPMNLSIMKYYESSIAVLKGDDEQLDLWVMKEYGVVGSWTKVLHLTDQSGGLPSVLGFRKNGEVLLQVDGGVMASLDLNCQQMKHLGIEAEASFGDSYMESLVLLDKGVDSGSVMM